MPVTWTFLRSCRSLSGDFSRNFMAFLSLSAAVPWGASNKYFNCLSFMFLVTHSHAKKYP